MRWDRARPYEVEKVTRTQKNELSVWETEPELQRTSIKGEFSGRFQFPGTGMRK